MLILMWIRKIYKSLSADASPPSIAFAVLFGLMLGFVPFLSEMGLFLIALMLVIRVQISAAFLAMAIGKLLSLAGLSHYFVPLGAMLLNPEAFHGFWTWFLNLPVIAWLGMNKLAITGGVVLGFLIGAVLFFPIMKFVTGYRRFVHDRLAQNKFFRWLTSFWLIKGLRFVFIGTEIDA